ncbi:LysR family transcriptional regulator [Enterobacteriaceae bacterium Kacie_13]|nr:LysR family transcriptional regulator [Enterobacteriaceae bacterium Kacie_13]
MPNKRSRAVSKFDLNLLATYETIYMTRSVTKAAKSLNLTPSSVSQSLQKLRDFFADPLFIRTHSGLVPTAMATDIYTQLLQTYGGLMSSLESMTQGDNRDLLTVHCPTYVAMRIVPAISHWLEIHAPHCKVLHRDFLRDLDSPEELLQRRGVDLLFDVSPCHSFALETVPLYQEGSMFICRKNHPRLGSSISKEEAALERFALFETEGMDIQLGQLHVKKQFGERKTAIGSSSLMTILSTVEETDIVGVIPVWLYQKLKNSYDIRTLDRSFKTQVVTTYMMYHKNALHNGMFSGLVSWLEKHFEEE